MQKSWVTILIVILIIALLAGGVFYLYKYTDIIVDHKKTPATATSTAAKKETYCC